MTLARWVTTSWKQWVSTHPWTTLYVVGVTTLNFVLEMAEALL
jgi:hypothetical protein